jgi:hypothetical protein
MANSKISQLPLFTGDTTGSYVIMNNSGETETFKVTKSVFLDSGAAAFSWENIAGSDYANLTNATENYPRWNTTIFNSNTGIFELVNSGQTGNTGARIHFKEPGYYEIISSVHIFDLFNNIDVTIRLNSSTTSNGSMTVGTMISDFKSAETTGDQIIYGHIIINVTTPTYYTVSVNPSANTPFPSSTNDSPTRLFIKKLAI